MDTTICTNHTAQTSPDGLSSLDLNDQGEPLDLESENKQLKLDLNAARCEIEALRQAVKLNTAVTQAHHNRRQTLEKEVLTLRRKLCSICPSPSISKPLVSPPSDGGPATWSRPRPRPKSTSLLDKLDFSFISNRKTYTGPPRPPPPLVPFETNLEALQTFYLRYAPSRVAGVGLLLRSYSVKQLNSALKKRYGAARAPVLSERSSAKRAPLSNQNLQGPLSLPPKPPGSKQTSDSAQNTPTHADAKHLNKSHSPLASNPTRNRRNSNSDEVHREVNNALTSRVQVLTENNFQLKRKLTYAQSRLRALTDEVGKHKKIGRTLMAKIQTGALCTDKTGASGKPDIDLLAQVSKQTRNAVVLGAFSKMELVVQETILQNNTLKQALKTMGVEMDRMRLRFSILREENRLLKQTSNSTRKEKNTSVNDGTTVDGAECDDKEILDPDFKNVELDCVKDSDLEHFDPRAQHDPELDPQLDPELDPTEPIVLQLPETEHKEARSSRIRENLDNSQPPPLLAPPPGMCT
ncbi:hypothetical protein AAMO2058_000127100 [Amorphochlora amoebiformis]